MAKATRVRAVLLENRNSKPALRSPEEKWKAETPRLNCIASRIHSREKKFPKNLLQIWKIGYNCYRGNGIILISLQFSHCAIRIFWWIIFFCCRPVLNISIFTNISIFLLFYSIDCCDYRLLNICIYSYIFHRVSTWSLLYF